MYHLLAEFLWELLEMKKKSKITPVEQDVVEGFVERNIDEAPEASGIAHRITIHTNSEGGIDWEKSKSGTDDDLLQAITSDPVMLEKLASHPDFADATSDGISHVTNEEAGMVLDLLTMGEGILFGSLSAKIMGLKIDSSVIKTSFVLNEKDHERQDPLAAQGLTMLQEWLEFDPRWKWAALLVVAHAAAIGRNVRECIVKQYAKEESEPENPATRNNIVEGEAIQ